jgi:hypothetical protein
MFKKPTKKQLAIRRALVSIVATVAVLIIVTVSILFMLGYRLDSSNRLEQGALLQFNSVPDTAQVWIDGKQVGQTATKQTVLAGVHAIKMSKAGYQDWNRTLDFEAGTLTWLDYTRLVPNDRPVQSVAKFASLAALEFSSDYRWGLALPTANVPTFDVIDLRSQDVKMTQLTLDQALYADAATPDVAHQFSIHAWSSAGRYVLIKHTYGDAKTEWILLDTQDGARSVNITQSLNVELADVKFSSDSGTGLYGLGTDGVLRKLDVSGGTLSRGLVSHVTSFSVLEENSVVSYVGTDPSDATKNVAGVYRDGDTSSRVLRSSSDAATPLQIAVGRYFNEDYIAIGENNTMQLYTGPIPSASNQDAKLRMVTELSLNSALTSLSFSPGGDYVMAQSGTTFTSYEIEHNRPTMSSFAASEGQPAPSLQWLDQAHYWNVYNGTVYMRDFDGTNVHDIMTAAPGFDVSLSQNGRYFYTVAQDPDGSYHLQRIRMILN